MTWDAEYDVVVVGSGAGAMTGAYLAAKAGKKVAVVEKTDRLGGTTAYSGAAAWLPGTVFQERAGLVDSTESARTYLNALLDEPDTVKPEAFPPKPPGLGKKRGKDHLLGFHFKPFPANSA